MTGRTVNAAAEPIIWSPETIRQLGPTTNVPTAASILGINEQSAYGLIRRAEWPTRVLRLGRVIRIPTNDLVHLLYGGPDTAVEGTGPCAFPVQAASISAGQKPKDRIDNAV